MDEMTVTRTAGTSVAVSKCCGPVIDFSAQGIPVIDAAFSEDVSDLSALPEIEERVAEIMALPAEERNAAFAAQSPILADLCVNQASYRALEQVHSKDGIRFHGLEGVDDGGIARKWFECWLLGRGVRERNCLTTEILRQAICDRLQYSRSIQLASIASGSARCVVEAIEQVQPADVAARMLDWDEEALAYTRQLAAQAGIIGQVQTMMGNVIKFKKYLAETPVHVLEAVGILDYFDDATIKFFLGQARDVLAPGGLVIAANMTLNAGSEFLHTAVGWRPMIYRTESAFAQLFLDAGFKVENCAIYRHPLHLYSTVTATK